MRKTTRKRAFDQWTQGSFYAKGADGNPDTNSKAYQSTNMQVYRNGTLGVRPWLRQWPNTQDSPNPWTVQPAHYTASMMWVDGIWSYTLPTSRADDSGYIFVSGTGSSGIYSLAAEAWQQETNWPNTNLLYRLLRPSDHPQGGQPQSIPVGNLKWLMMELTATATVRLVDGSALTTTEFLWPAAPVTGGNRNVVGLTLHLDRAYLAYNNRVLYSDVASYAQTGSDQFFDIGGVDAVITGLYSINDALLICTSDNRWFTLTGPPDTGTLRQVEQSVTPGWPNNGVVMGRRMYFLAENGYGINIATSGGVDSQTLDHVRPNRDRLFGEKTIYPGKGVANKLRSFIMLPYERWDSDDPDFMDGYQSLEMHLGVWHHNLYWWGSGESDHGLSQGLSAVTRGTVVGADMAGDHALAIVTREASTAPRIYTRDLSLDRPSNSTDTYSDYQETYEYAASNLGGDTQVAGGHLKLRDIRMEPGEELRISKVHVDFNYWYTDGVSVTYQAPRFSVIASVDGVRSEGSVFKHDGSDSGSLGTASAVTDSWAYGEEQFRRETFTAGETKWGLGLGVELTNIQSVAIERIIVEYETRETSPRRQEA